MPTIYKGVKHRESKEKLSELIGLSAYDKLIDDILKNDIPNILTSNDVNKALIDSLPLFKFKIMGLLLQTSVNLFENKRIKLDEVIELWKEFAKNVADALRSSNNRNAEDLVYSYSILIDQDIWVINKVKEYGLDGFLRRISDRASQEASEMPSHMILLLFAWLSAVAAIFRLVNQFKEENAEELIRISKRETEELDLYIDTLDLLISDDSYKALKESGMSADLV